MTADKARRDVLPPGEHRVGPLSNQGRRPVGDDGPACRRGAALDQAADARSLMAMQIGAAARRERDAVAAQSSAPSGRASSCTASFSRETAPGAPDSTAVGRSGEELPPP